MITNCLKIFVDSVTEMSQQTWSTYLKHKNQMEYKTDENSWPYYEELPEHFTLAKMEDFYGKHGYLIEGKPFLVHSLKYPGRYWAYRVRKGFPYPGTDFEKFLAEDRVYVYEKPE